MSILNRISQDDTMMGMNPPMRAQVKVPNAQESNGTYDVLIENISKSNLNGERNWNTAAVRKSKAAHRVDSTTQLSKNGYTVLPSTQTLKQMEEENERRRQEKLIEDERMRVLNAMPLWKLQERQRQVRQQEQLRYLYHKEQKKSEALAQSVAQGEQLRANKRNAQLARSNGHVHHNNQYMNAPPHIMARQRGERFEDTPSQFIAPQRVPNERIQNRHSPHDIRDSRRDGYFVYTTLPKAKDEVSSYGFGGSLPNPKSALKDHNRVRQYSDTGHKAAKVSVVRFR